MARPQGTGDDIGAYESYRAPGNLTLTAPSTIVKDGTLSVTATAYDQDRLPITYSFVLRKGNTVLFRVTNATGKATFDLSTVNNETTGDIITTDVTADNGRATSQIVSANTTVIEPKSLVVTTLSDSSTNTDGVTSLREAINYANSTPSSDVITFKVSGTILLQSFLPYVSAAATSGTLTVRNTQPASVTINGNGSRIFLLLDVVDLTVENLTLTNTQGGALYNYKGKVTVNNCTISNGLVTSNGGSGILNDEAGTLSVKGSTLTGNTASSGGAIENRGLATISNSTFTNNTAMYNGGAVLNESKLTVTNCTLSGNSANKGGAISNNDPNSATMTLKNSIVTGNTATTNPNINGSFTDGGTNLTNGDALLGTLKDNGGPTQTFELLPGSPAIDAGNSEFAIDQRGIARPQGSAADIGAFEAGAVKPTVIISSPTSNQKVLFEEFTGNALRGAASGANGINAVKVRLSRKRGTTNTYWNGTDFVTTIALLDATVSTKGDRNVSWTLNGQLPPLGKLDIGLYNVQISAVDVLGNKSAYADVAFTLSTDFVAPSLKISSPSVNQKALFSEFNGTFISGTASDDKQVSNVKVRLSRKRNNVNQYWNGTDFVTASSTVDATLVGTTDVNWSLGNRTPPTGKLDAGAYQVEAFATDGAGNQSSTDKRSFTLSADFVAPSVSISTPSVGQHVDINAFGAGTISGVASDNIGVTTVKVKLQHKRGTEYQYWNGTAFTTTSAVVEAIITRGSGLDVTWILATPIPANKLDIGAYTAYASAYDATGNSLTTPSRSFYVTGTAPAPSASPASSAGGS